jgi:hypothetical protein
MEPTCPRCGEPLEDCPSISRHDNETPICSDCGMREAFEDSGMAPAYAGEPYWMTTGEEWLAHRAK